MAPSSLLLIFLTVSCAVSALAGWGLAWRLSRRTVPSEERGSPASMASPLPDAALLADTIPGMALVLGSMGQVLACNAEAQTHYGDSLNALLRHPNARDALNTALHAPAISGAGLPASCSTTISLDVPVKRSVRLSMRRLAGTSGRDSLILTLLNDRSTVQAVDRMRADFVAHASHELRTPLASLSGFIDLLRDDDGQTDPSSRTLYLDIMSQQATRMQRLIDRLLYLSQLELKTHHRPHERLDVEELFALILGEVTPRFRDTSRRLSITQKDSLSLLADEDEMVQLFLNLIENSIRHGTRPDQPLHVRLNARRATADDHPASGSEGILLSVTDDGPGIEAHHLPRLTERFYRVTNRSDGTAGAEQGTGLGLAIVRQILERHSGHLRFDSTPGKGTACLIWLPAAPSIMKPDGKKTPIPLAEGRRTLP